MLSAHPHEGQSKGVKMWRRSWVKSALRAVDKDVFRETVAVVLTATTITLGVVLIAAAERWVGEDTFSHITEVAPVQTWGVAFIVCGVTLLATVLSSRKDAYWPALFLTGLY